MTDKIYLVGFMAVGKSTLAARLAARLGWRAEDVDDLIETREQRTVAEIFVRDGEPHFRAVEREIVRLLLPMRHLVVATGGGTFVDPESRAAINRDGASVWLDAPLERIVERLAPDGRRPLLSVLRDRAQLERLYTTRVEAYRQAHLRLDAGGQTPDELVDQILRWLDADRTLRRCATSS